MSYLYLGKVNCAHFFVGFNGTMPSQIYNVMISDTRIRASEYVCVLNGDQCTFISHITSPLFRVDATNISSVYQRLLEMPRENTQSLLYVEEGNFIATYEIPWADLPIAGISTNVADIDYVITQKPINY